MKKLIGLFVIATAFFSCDKNDKTEIQPEVVAKIIGHSELYRDENLESVIDQWTGTEWTYINQWFQNTREDSRINLEFKADGTFIDRYAEVEIASGVWVKIDNTHFYFDYNIPVNNTNEFFTHRYFITVYCDNTYSIKAEGNENTINYYRKLSTTECSDVIEYKAN